MAYNDALEHGWINDEGDVIYPANETPESLEELVEMMKRHKAGQPK